MNLHLFPVRGGKAQTSGGFAMLEALVGLLIFSIGILGLVGVQASMTKAQTQSKFRADAASLASEAVGAMWSDLPNVTQYDGASCSTYAACKRWSEKVSSALPGGAADISVVDGMVTITISWTSPNEPPSRYITATAIRS